MSDVKHVDFARDKFSAIKGLSKTLVSFLNSMDEGPVVRVILRTIKFLTFENGKTRTYSYY